MGCIKLNGKRTTIERVNVEVDTQELLDIIHKKLGFNKEDYVDGDSYYEYEGDNYHTGDHLYKVRKATSKELDAWKACCTVRRAFE